jgi:hypothetical protein
LRVVISMTEQIDTLSAIERYASEASLKMLGPVMGGRTPSEDLGSPRDFSVARELVVEPAVASVTRDHGQPDLLHDLHVDTHP